jgi:hypothetical protein
MQFNEKRDFLATRRSNLLTQLDIERSKNDILSTFNEQKILKSEFLNFDVVEKSNFDVKELREFIEKFNSLLNGSFEISKHEIIDSVKSLVKNLNHIDTGKNLDGRM